MAEHIFHVLGPLDVPSLGPRRVRVYAPARKRRAPPSGPSPVLYMFDGQNLFHDEPSFAGGWHLHRTAHRLMVKHGRAPVIVGIDHGGAARIGELSPWPTSEGKSGADALLDWMTGTLIPRLHHEFGVSRDPAHAGIGGSSMGGLAALYAHFRNPEHFGLALAMSPSLWLSGGRIYDYIASRAKPWTSRIYLDAGGLEGRGAMAAAAQRLVDHLRGRGYDDASLRWVLAKKGTHSEANWRRRAPRAIEFLYGLGGK